MYNNIREFIDELKRNVRVIALIKYGKREVDDMSLGEDFALYVIMNDFSSNIESIHFYIETIPIDVNVRGYSDLLLKKPISKTDLELFSGEILFDKSGIISRMLNKSKENWVIEKEEKKKISKNEIERIRYSYKHILDKLKNSLDENNLQTKFNIDITMKRLVDQYFELNDLYYDEDKLLDIIKKNEPLFYSYLDDFYSARSIEKKYKMLSKIAGVVFKDSNGICKENEVMFLARDYEEEISDDEKDEIIEMLALFR
ncbi:MAG: hypothetical protein ABF289_00640 [Clostridiales bacterium]